MFNTGFGVITKNDTACNCLVGTPYMDNGVCKCDTSGYEKTQSTSGDRDTCNCVRYPCNCHGTVIDLVSRIGNNQRNQFPYSASTGTNTNNTPTAVGFDLASLWGDNKKLLIGLGVAGVAGYFLLKDK